MTSLVDELSDMLEQYLRTTGHAIPLVVVGRETFDHMKREKGFTAEGSIYVTYRGCDWEIYQTEIRCR